MSKEPRVSFPDLDIAKLVMALFVVEIHTRPLEGCGAAGDVAGAVDCVAVPFFFITSAFLCFRALQPGDFRDRGSAACARVRGTVAKLLRLYLIWTAIYLPVSVYGFVLSGYSFAKGFAVFLRGVVLVGENFCSWPLWYLLASVVAFCIVYCFLRLGVRPRLVFLVSLLFALLGFSMELAHGWAGLPSGVTFALDCYFKVFLNVRNGLFEGFFYVSLGMLLGMRWDRAVSVAPAISVLVGVLGLAGCVLVTPDAHLPFCAAYALGVFLLSVRRCGAGLNPHPVARNLSTGVYLTHMLFVVLFVYGVCGYVGTAFMRDPGISHAALFAFALGGSVVVSLASIVASRRSKVVKKVFGY